MPSVGNQFVNYSDWLNLNQSDAQRMAQQLASNVQGQGQGATDALAQLQAAFSPTSQDPNAPKSLSDEAGYQAGLTQANTAQTSANQLGNAGGIAQALATQYGAPANRFDAALAGSAGGQQFSNLQQQYGALNNAFGVANQNSINQWNDPNNSRWRNPGAPMAQQQQQPGPVSNGWTPGYQQGSPSGPKANPYDYENPMAPGNTHVQRTQSAGAGHRNIYDGSSGGTATTGWGRAFGGGY